MAAGIKNFQFDRQKFKSVVHYICSTCPADKLGAVKLHKVLYFSDMLFFVQEGHPITGETYKKQQFGPTASHLNWAIRELSRDGALVEREVPYYGFVKREFAPRKEPDISSISSLERSLIDEMVRFVCFEHTAKEVSELSHTEVWKAAEIGEELPYITALALYPAEITEDDMAWATEEINKIVHEGVYPRPV